MKKSRLGIIIVAFFGILIVSSSHASERVATRTKVYQENPFLRQAVGRVGGFGNTMSAAIANRMHSRTDPAALADAANMLSIETHGPGRWLLRFPWVNVAVFETREGLVLVDSAYAPAGPALLAALKSLSDKPVHTIIYTHHHLDHMLGAWSLLEAGQKPQIIASRALVDEVQRDIRSRELTSRLNSQRLEDYPRTTADLPMPTRTFDGQLELVVGDDRFVLHHAPGETADQLWVSVPTRQTVVIADYFQPFLPNAGNGKRRQRYVESWAAALRAMVEQKPILAIPMHGPAIKGSDEISNRLGNQARMLQSIADQTLDALNAGVRKYDVADGIRLPDDLKAKPDAAELYSTAADMSRTVAQEYTGWWNELPSEWSPATRQRQATLIVEMSGGVDRVLERIMTLRQGDIVLACHLVDWAWLAYPSDARVLQAATETWLTRLRTTAIPTQEAVEYVEHLVTLRQRLDELKQP
jgi:alkyl sulfatase BDS1-like metallo-beta-lactamase superfamily hydrolase